MYHDSLLMLFFSGSIGEVSNFVIYLLDICGSTRHITALATRMTPALSCHSSQTHSSCHPSKMQQHPLAGSSTLGFWSTACELCPARLM